MSESANKLLARKMISMHAAHDEGWVDACYHPDCDWVELPFAGNAGRSGDAAVMKAAAADSAKYFPHTQIVINNIMEEGDQVALEVDFVGTMAVKAGSDKPARQSKVKMAIFLTLREGLISRQVDYLVPMA
ncbi:MAG: ketosteroid isomerase-like protein [Paraglaciecola psychrophila]|jgi:ketosteroid isomerase-like protein